MAGLANLYFHVKICPDSINFYFSGYSDSMSNFITESLTRLINMKDQNLWNIFNNTKERLLQDWKNNYLSPSSHQIYWLQEVMMYDYLPEMRTNLKVLEPYTYDVFK